MQVTETLNESLKREYKIVIPATEIDTRTTQRLEELKDQVRLPGFRPGKVPLSMMRQRYGKSVLGEVLEKAVQESITEVIDTNGLKPAMQPNVDLVGEVEDGKDLEFTMAVEVLPEIGELDFSSVALEREVAVVAAEKVDEALEDLRQRSKAHEPAEGKVAENGDMAKIDFLGKLDGEPFEGGAAEDYDLELGSGSFIPGFEDQLVGLKAGDAKTVEVSFPEDYPAEHLAGKPVLFEVTVKEIKQAIVPEIDDELAKKFGKETLDELKEAVRGDLQGEYDEVSKAKVKRKLLDALADAYSFDVPEGLVSAEFDGIWGQIQQAKEQGSLEEEDAGKSDEELTTEYRAIAERRVRLGLLLAEVGQRNEINVAQDDLNKALMREMRRYPGQEAAVINYYRNNPQAMDSLRAPVFEDKVCDFILELAKVTEKSVAVDALLADPDADEGEEMPAKKSSKKAASKKAEADAEAGDGKGEEKPKAKKTRAKKSDEASEEG
ncbi:MAG: trigger factor [Rhodospirillum sp.]|nr:trigger factor [Rhodospirillum sp.]MCF8489003.1 trigger factor [Rhodospirillum sp.]MCF8499944.1 trigger factor [Rhodospirillum sp.]